MKKWKKIICVVSAALLLICVTSSCANSDPASPAAGTTTEKSSSSNAKDDDSAEGSEAIATDGDTTAELSFEKPTSLTYWCQIDQRITKFISSMDESPTFLALKEELGVDITFIHPPQDMDQEQFKVLISSNDLPDIIEYQWFDRYPGGPGKAISDGVIYDLTPYITEEITPNFLKVLDKYEADYKLASSIKTLEGQYYVFPCVRGEGLLLQINNGPIIRQDWLDELDMDVPETLDDWYEMLTAFKNEMGSAIPLTFKESFFKDGQDFVGAFGVGHDFYIDTNDVIQYGPMQPEYKNFYELMSKWYAEGLIEPDFATINDDGVHQNMTSGNSGACIGQNDSTMAVVQAAMAESDPNFNLVGAPHPKVNADDPDVRIFKRDWFYTISGCAAISTSCDNPAGAAWVLDYFYGPEGHMLGNFGVEDESYTVESDGTVKFTDHVMNNEDGNSFKEMVHFYSRGAASAPLVRDVQVIDAQRSDQRVIDATETWAKVLDRSSIVPRLSFSEEENTRLSKLYIDIETYQKENFQKFIMGRTPVSEFEKTVEELEKMNIAEVLEIYNTAYERYKAL